MKIKLGNKILTEFRNFIGEDEKYDYLWNLGYSVRVGRVLGFKFLVWESR